MTQHIKTHFKARGINSLANNPATLQNFLSNHRSTLSQFQIPEDQINAFMNGEGFVHEDQDNAAYPDEQIGHEDANGSVNMERGDNENHVSVTPVISRENCDDGQEIINPC